MESGSVYSAGLQELQACGVSQFLVHSLTMTSEMKLALPPTQAVLKFPDKVSQNNPTASIWRKSFFLHSRSRKTRSNISPYNRLLEELLSSMKWAVFRGGKYSRGLLLASRASFAFYSSRLCEIKL